MKNIIILGEEYWFDKPDTPFTEATYLLKSLEIHRDKNKYNYIIIKSPSELIETIDKKYCSKSDDYRETKSSVYRVLSSKY